jgi:hypothetical protein
LEQQAGWPAYACPSVIQSGQLSSVTVLHTLLGDADVSGTQHMALEEQKESGLVSDLQQLARLAQALPESMSTAQASMFLTCSAHVSKQQFSCEYLGICCNYWDLCCHPKT